MIISISISHQFCTQNLTVHPVDRVLFLEPKPLSQQEIIYIIFTMLPRRWFLLFLLLPLPTLLLYFFVLRCRQSKLFLQRIRAPYFLTFSSFAVSYCSSQQNIWVSFNYLFYPNSLLNISVFTDFNLYHFFVLKFSYYSYS